MSDEFSVHEALDRTYLVAEILDTVLCEHPAIKENSEWLKLVSSAGDSLGRLYQLIGAFLADNFPDDEAMP